MKSRHALAALALAAAFPLAACGDDDDGGDSGTADNPTSAAFELKPSGKKATMEGPSEIKAGVTRISFTNSTKDGGGVQLVRIEGDHTGPEALKAGDAWGEGGKPLPDWMLLEGGVPNTGPGKKTAVTQSLVPGKYIAADLESNAVAEFEVTGEKGEDISAPAATIAAKEYSFTASGLKAGQTEVTFENTGKQPHFVVGVPLKPGKTIEDAKKFFGTEDSKEEPPADENDPAAFDTAVTDGGNKQQLSLELKKGKYVLLCFIPDRQGGPPHVAKGMISEAVVE
jgi:hypothetical protein